MTTKTWRWRHDKPKRRQASPEGESLYLAPVVLADIASRLPPGVRPPSAEREFAEIRYAYRRLDAPRRAPGSRPTAPAPAGSACRRRISASPLDPAPKNT